MADVQEEMQSLHPCPGRFQNVERCSHPSLRYQHRACALACRVKVTSQHLEHGRKTLVAITHGQRMLLCTMTQRELHRRMAVGPEVGQKLAH